MCGIVCQLSKTDQPVNRSVAKYYKKQKHRGTQGYGFVAQYGEIVKKTRATLERDALTALYARKSNMVMFHHRMPTSTDNVLNSCHPFKATIGDRSLYLVHNGWITNSYDLETKHSDEGIGYVSKETYTGKTANNATYTTERFNDSEALAWDVAHVLFKDELPQARGMIAFIALETTPEGHPKVLHFYRNEDAPLRMTNDDNNLMLGSETPGISIEANMLYSYDIETKTMAMRPMYFGALQYQKTQSYYDDWGDWTRKDNTYTDDTWDSESRVWVKKKYGKTKSKTELITYKAMRSMSAYELADKAEQLEDKMYEIEANGGDISNMYTCWLDYQAELDSRKFAGRRDENRL